MSKQQELLDFYKSVLKAVSIEEVSNGKLSDVDYTFSEDGSRQKEVSPQLIDGKRLVLPTQEFLKRPNWDECIPFHPYSENILKGESDIIKFLKRRMVVKLNVMTCDLLNVMMYIAQDPEVQRELSEEQAQYLTKVDKATDSTYNRLISLLDEASNDILGIYLTRLDSSKEGISRKATLTFPLYKAICDSTDTKVMGVDLKVKKNKELIKNLIEYIFPDIEDKDSWSVGSNATFPYFDSLVSLFDKVSIRLSYLTRLYSDYTPKGDVEAVDNSGWVDMLSQMDKYKSVIPPLTGNIGATGLKEKTTTAPMKPTVKPSMSEYTSRKSETEEPPWDDPRQDHVPTPPNVQHVEQRSDGKVSWNQVKPPTAMMPYPQGNTWVNSPQQGYPQQMYQQPRQPMSWGQAWSQGSMLTKGNWGQNQQGWANQQQGWSNNQQQGWGRPQGWGSKTIKNI